MAYANPRLRNGITKSMVQSRPRPPLPHTVTSNTNDVTTVKQSEYIMRHSHEAIVKKYKQSICKLADDFERDLQLKDEIIMSLRAEIARLKCSGTMSTTKTEEFMGPDDTDDLEECEIEQALPLLDDRDESMSSSYVTQELCFVGGTIDDDDYEDVYEDEEEEELEEEEDTNGGGSINDEQRTLKLLSIKIQPNKNEVIHRCDRCDKVVSTRRTLMKHIRIVHATQKPYSCDYCTRSFPQKDGLKRHLRIHTGEKPFACQGCSRSFNQSGNLRIHEKSCKKLISICNRTKLYKIDQREKKL